MDLGTVRTFVAVADAGQFSVAADGQAFLPHAREPLLDVVAASPAVATLVGEQTHLLWPDGYDLRRIALRDPVPVYPHSLIWRGDNKHPALAALRDHLSVAQPGVPGTWVPERA